MLVLSRKVGQRILIGDDVTVTIVRIGQGGVRVGIDAPSSLIVVREELAQQQSPAPEKDAPLGGRVLPR
jgi:carbon storage regulator